MSIGQHVTMRVDDAREYRDTLQAARDARNAGNFEEVDRLLRHAREVGSRFEFSPLPPPTLRERTRRSRLADYLRGLADRLDEQYL